MKKSFKVLKSIIMSLVLLSYCASNYAAVSVSDGSAFVTKSEFSTDLNNLENRVSQIEKKKKKKIDGLVSSYLSRNGIWNGSKQDIKVGGYITSWNLKNNEKQFALQNPPNSFSSTPEAIFVDNIYGKSLFFKANKSGLCCISVSTCAGYNSSTGLYSTDNRRSFNYVANGTSFFSTGSSKGFYLAWEIIDKNDDVLSAIQLASANLTFSTDWSKSGFMAVYENFSTLVQFFVNKEDNIYNRIRLKYNLSGMATTNFTFTAQMSNVWNMLLHSVNIY